MFKIWQVFSSFVRAIFGSAAWDGVKYLYSIGGGIVSSLVLFLIEKWRSVPTDWLVMVTMGIIGFLLMFSAFRTSRQRGNLANSSLDHGGLVVHYGGYGLGFGQYRNVTERVKGFVENDRLHMRVGSESLQCDPYRGKLKHLLVIYSHGSGEGKSVQVEDEQLLELP